MAYSNLNKMAKDAIDKELKRRAILHLDAAVWTVLDTHSTKEAIKILREFAQHIEDHS